MPTLLRAVPFTPAAATRALSVTRTGRPSSKSRQICTRPATLPISFPWRASAQNERRLRPMIKIIAKAVRIMNLFSASQPRLSVSEVARRMEMPKSTAHNILKSLATEGFIERCEKDAYALGTGIIRLTQKVRVNVEVRDRAAPHVRALADRCGESVYLTVRDGDEVLYIYAVESSRRLRARTAIGDRGMLHCTGVGKALLGRMAADEIVSLVARTGLPRLTPFTMTSPEAVLAEAAATALRGFSFDRQENELSNYCVGS